MMSTPTALVFAVPASSSSPRRTTVLGLSTSVSPGLPAFVAVGVFCAALMLVFAAAGCLAWWYPRCEDPRSLWWRTLLTALVALAAMVVSGSALSAGWAGLVVSAVVVVLLAAALTVARWLSQQRNRAGKAALS